MPVSSRLIPSAPHRCRRQKRTLDSITSSSVILVVVAASFEETVKDAVMEGPTGEARLVGMIDSLAGAAKVLAVAALGDAQGDQGPAALRRLLAVTNRSVDLQCAALLALAKREGTAASEVLAAHLTHASAAVRDYAIISLAAVGDDRAWPQVHMILRQDLDRPPPTAQPQQLIPGLKQFKLLTAVTYLVRHLAIAPADRIPQLVSTLRSRFDRLYVVEQDWLSTHWPGIDPAGPAPDRINPPDPQPFRDWVSATRLFASVF